jgi:very-short-patch-repair endonuclease
MTFNRRIRGTTPELIATARKLRQQLTPAEAMLWKALQKRRLNGLKFRCQHPVCGFVVDFYCPECRLVIELDGNVHDDRTDYDAERTVRLNDQGYCVLRFRNEVVMTDLDRVLCQILEVCDRINHSQGHPNADDYSLSKSPKVGDLGGERNA